MNDTRRATVLLSTQRALLGEVTTNLVAVAVAWSDASIQIDFFFGLPPDDLDKESADCVVTELIADFPEYEVTLTTKLWDAAYALPDGGVWVFLRSQ
mgnify:CR=1 FL=1